MSNKRICLKTFVLPMQDAEASDLMNRRDVTVLINERHPCPKDGVILLHLQYEEEWEPDYGDDDDF